MEHHLDTLIIGAGVAGLAAARTLDTYNAANKDKAITYQVLEASDKIGGRVQSEMVATRQGDFTINTGAHWFHSDPTPGAAENPLLKHINPQDREHDSMPRDFYDEGSRRNWSDKVQILSKARRAIDSHQGDDIDLLELFKQQGLNSFALNTTFGESETGMPLRDVSVEDVKSLVPCHMGDFSRKSLSEFIDDYAKGIREHITLSAPVQKIIRNTADESRGVEVHTRNGDVYYAKRLILTPSVGVLKSGAITFEPPLPKAHRDALEHIKMGDFNKVFLFFDKGFKFPVNRNTHLDVQTKGGEDIFYLARAGGKQMVVAFFGGELAKRCDEQPGEMIRLATEGLREIWGDEIAKHIVDARHTSWGNNEFVRGGYSRTDVGHFNAREKLAKPIDNLIYLAGEAMGATHPETGQNWSTHMAGAALSGERAANLALESLDKIAPKSKATKAASR